MKILIHTRFHPSVGGIETAASILANEWTRECVHVTVVTDIPTDSNVQRKFPFLVYHRPSAIAFVKLLFAHDIFVHFNVSLRALWPLLFVHRPWIASHHGWYQINRSGERDWRERLKLRFAKLAVANIAASRAIAQTIDVKCEVIPNPYNAAIFYQADNVRPNKDLIFVGRLVSDKGVDVLIKALETLKQNDLTTGLTVVGEGPERSRLENLTAELGLTDQTHFTGTKSQSEVAELLRQHKILVVPSIWKEPFGIVALEGIASGCVIVGSDGGGLPEAIGQCGITFAHGDAGDLAEKLRLVLDDEAMREQFQKHAVEHLAKHRPDVVAKRYIDVFERVLGAVNHGKS